MDTERWVYKERKTIHSMERLDKEIQRQRLNSCSAGRERVVVNGRGLRTAADLFGLLMMITSAIMSGYAELPTDHAQALLSSLFRPAHVPIWRR